MPGPQTTAPAPAAPPQPWHKDWPAIAATVAIGSLAGALASYLTLPLPWMIGSMLCIMSLALAGVAVRMPRRLVNLTIPVLGVWLGSGFSPDLLGQMVQWLPSVIGVLVWMAASGATGFLYYRKVARFDPATAFFSSMPGGLNDMTLIGTAMGGDPRLIPLIHLTRMVTTIVVIPFWFRFVNHVPPAGARGHIGLLDNGLPDLAILLACAVVGALASLRLRLPAPYLLGAMALSALVHATGLTASKPPTLLVSGAQVLLGCNVGVRFVGVSLRYIGNTVRHGLITTTMILACTVLCALAVQAISGYPLPQLVLAYSPGGLTEMSLIALALGIDPAFVALHHLLRMMSVIGVAPLVFRLFRRPPLPGTGS